jgi:transposase
MVGIMEIPPITTDCPQCKPLIDQLLAIIVQQQDQINAIQARLEKVEREGKRQAAPCLEKRTADPKKPGRKTGHPHCWPILTNSFVDN